MPSKKRQKQQEKKKERQKAEFIEGKGKSKYALKHRDQAKGVYRETSPFTEGEDSDENDRSLEGWGRIILESGREQRKE